MKKTFLFVLLILVSLSLAQSQRYLHVSTIPNGADIFVEELKPDLARVPDYRSPQFIPLDSAQNQQGEILLHLFRPEFNDTTIRVRLSDRDTSFLIVSLRPTYDNILLDEQQRILSKRSRRSIGHKLMISSAIPFLVSATAGIVSLYQIDKAEDKKKEIEQSLFKDAGKLDKAIEEFDDSRKSAKNAKYTTITSFAIGASLLALGFVLSF